MTGWLRATPLAITELSEADRAVLDEVLKTWPKPRMSDVPCSRCREPLTVDEAEEHAVYGMSVAEMLCSPCISKEQGWG